MIKAQITSFSAREQYEVDTYYGKTTDAWAKNCPSLSLVPHEREQYLKFIYLDVKFFLQYKQIYCLNFLAIMIRSIWIQR